MIDAPDRTKKESFEAQGSQLVEKVKDLESRGWTFEAAALAA